MACMHFRLLYVLLFISGALKAQLREFTISEMPSSEVAVVQANTQFSDDALLLIYSTIESLEIRSSLGAIDKVSFNAAASRYEVLVKPVKQMLFAAKSGFIEAKIATLNPNPKDVFYYKVEEKKNEIPDAATGKLSVQSEPAGAEILLNGFKVADRTPYTFDLNSGLTKIKLKKKKFEDFDTSIVVLSNQVSTLNSKLNSCFLYLNLTSNPIGASVSIDGVELGKTPLNKEIDLSNNSLRGLKLLSIALPSYESVQKEISYYPSNAPLEFNFDLIKSKGTYSITSNPSGASVYFNGTYKGLTPLSGNMEYGTYEISLQMDEYQNAEKKTLSLNSTALKQLDFILKPIVRADDSVATIEISETKGEFPEAQEVLIGQQIWMTKNLNIDRFRNGEFISEAKTAQEWDRAGIKGEPAWCYYDNDPRNGEFYGKLYNWYAVSDARGLCPAGWHVPSDAEWTTLTTFLGGTSTAGGKMKSIGTEYWQGPNTSASNESGFSGLPAGSRDINGPFSGIGYYGVWWSSTENDTNNAWNRDLHFNDGDAPRINVNKEFCFSVRCLRD
jgi:uncharacterized protein (TIGR02145 family)